MIRITGFLFILNLCCATVFSQGIDYKGFPEWSIKKEDSTEYALYTPSNMKPGEKYPIVLFMHGCCGVDNKASLRNAVDPPLRMWHQFGANKQKIPTYLISPATKQGWQQHFKNLKTVIDDLVANHQGDPQRIYVTGFSMGGEGTFKIIQQYPGYFAAAMPMGMSFRGDSSKVKDIPLWINQGETDWFARFLRRQVGAIRALNGEVGDTGNTWVTGVNPRYSNFKGIGHGVQWAAASTQDLTNWAYSKINDGNIYPIIFFTAPEYRQSVAEGKPVTLKMEASDPDGSISKVDVYVNSVFIKSLTKSPFVTEIIPRKGDNVIEATAVDNKGKKTIAVNLLKVNMLPRLDGTVLPTGSAGAFYHATLTGKGNGILQFSLKNPGQLPHGIQLFPDGTIKGVTSSTATFKFDVVLKDEDNEIVNRQYTLTISPKKAGEILVTNVRTIDSSEYMVSKLVKGEVPNFNCKDSLLSTELEEINFSDLGKYEGFTYIKTDVRDTSKTAVDFLSFEIDEDAVIMVAYEKLDHPVKTTIPEWLKTFQKEDEEIVAQYRYYDVYSKFFKKGKVSLPGADAIKNGVGSNYFVMFKMP